MRDISHNIVLLMKLATIVTGFGFIFYFVYLMSGSMKVATNPLEMDLGLIVTNRSMTIGRDAFLNSQLEKSQKIVEAPRHQAAIEKVNKSGIFGAPPKPRPSELTGIAGDMAFISLPSGETKAMVVGQTEAGLTLLKIGTNRVLVQEDGEEKELTIYSGMGGESLKNTHLSGDNL
jgi:hypothetical protein